MMEEDKVVELITGTVIWLVVETPDGNIAGSAAAARNIGGQQDRIAEICGVAVEQTSQRRGMGSALLRQLQLELADIAEFVVCEAQS
jgi:ribosomal protein S18 acetylase RimI-like enzyme